jgi:DNA-directed RNA polymerase subunit RPC12/RpoP
VCDQFALFDRHTILDHCPNRLVGWGSVMGLDAGRVLKRSVLCSHCNEDYLFTLRTIAGNPELRCPGCGGSIHLSDRAYEPLLSDVGNALDEIDSGPPSFVSAHYRPAV